MDGKFASPEMYRPSRKLLLELAPRLGHLLSEKDAFGVARHYPTLVSREPVSKQDMLGQQEFYASFGNAVAHASDEVAARKRQQVTRVESFLPLPAFATTSLEKIGSLGETERSELLRGKYVLVGYSAPDDGSFLTPVGVVSDLVIQANIVNDLLQRIDVREEPVVTRFVRVAVSAMIPLLFLLIMSRLLRHCYKCLYRCSLSGAARQYAVRGIEIPLLPCGWRGY